MMAVQKWEKPILNSHLCLNQAAIFDVGNTDLLALLAPILRRDFSGCQLVQNIKRLELIFAFAQRDGAAGQGLWRPAFVVKRKRRQSGCNLYRDLTGLFRIKSKRLARQVY